MTTAIHLRSSSSAAQGVEKPATESARKKRLAECHVLAARIFDHYRSEAGYLDLMAAAELSGAAVLVGSPLPVFQKALILEWADKLWMRTQNDQPITSRRQLTAEQCGRLASAFRQQMQALGIEQPESRRDSALSGGEGPASTSDWKQLYKLRQRAHDQLGWSAEHCENFERRQLAGRRQIRSQLDARRVRFGYEGVLRKRQGSKEAESL